MIEAFGGRKFLAWVVSEIVLLGILVVLLVFDKMTEGIFYVWFGAQTANLGVFVAGNVAVDKASIAAAPKATPPAQ